MAYNPDAFSGIQSITIVARTSTSITIELAPVDGADYYRIAWRPSSETEADWLETSYLTWTISDYMGDPLVPGTTYVFNYVPYNYDGDSGSYMSPGVTISTSSLTKWSWWNSFIPGRPLNITAAEWNAFTDHINATLASYGIAQWSFVPVSSGEPMRAETANAARSAIGALLPIADESLMPVWLNPDDPIEAGYFYDLQDYLNSAIS